MRGGLGFWKASLLRRQFGVRRLQMDGNRIVDAALHAALRQSLAHAVAVRNLGHVEMIDVTFVGDALRYRKSGRTERLVVQARVR